MSVCVNLTDNKVLVGTITQEKENIGVPNIKYPLFNLNPNSDIYSFDVCKFQISTLAFKSIVYMLAGAQFC